MKASLDNVLATAGRHTALPVELRKRIRGEVRFSDGDRALSATDGSNYREVPIGVVIPRDVEDVMNPTICIRSKF